MVRWGILGCGSIATHAVAPAITWAKDAELVAVASRDARRAEEKRAQLGAARAHGSYEALIADRDVDAIYIGLPNGLHATWALRCAEAGRHVLCEKSIALDASTARRVAAAFRAKGLRLVEAFMYRHHPQWEIVRALLAERAIGELRSIRAGLSGTLASEGDHRWSAALGGGALFDVTCYAVNVARFLAGSEPVRVSAAARMHGDVDAATHASLEFPGGVLASVWGSLDSPPEQRAVAVGSGGRIEVERPFIPGWDTARVRLVQEHGERTIEVGGANHYLHMVEHFGALVRDPTLAMFPAEDGEANVTVCAAIAHFIVR